MSVVVAKVTDKYISMAADSGCYCGGGACQGRSSSACTVL